MYWTTRIVDYWTGHFSMLKSHWSNFNAYIHNVHNVQLATTELGSVLFCPGMQYQWPMTSVVKMQSPIWQEHVMFITKAYSVLVYSVSWVRSNALLGVMRGLKTCLHERKVRLMN